MLEFIAGLYTGGLFGIFLMCLIIVSKKGE